MRDEEPKTATSSPLSLGLNVSPPSKFEGPPDDSQAIHWRPAHPSQRSNNLSSLAAQMNLFGQAPLDASVFDATRLCRRPVGWCPAV